MADAWYEDEIRAAAEKHRLDPRLVKAIVQVESSGFTNAYRYEPAFFLRYLAHNPRYGGLNPRRVSASYGLMQVMYSTAVQHGYVGAPEGLFVPEVGLEYGCKHLRWLLDGAANGVVDAALAQYNGGVRGNQQPPYRNQEYVNKVQKYYRAYTMGDPA